MHFLGSKAVSLKARLKYLMVIMKVKWNDLRQMVSQHVSVALRFPAYLAPSVSWSRMATIYLHVLLWRCSGILTDLVLVVFSNVIKRVGLFSVTFRTPLNRWADYFWSWATAWVEAQGTKGHLAVTTHKHTVHYLTSGIEGTWQERKNTLVVLWKLGKRWHASLEYHQTMLNSWRIERIIYSSCVCASRHLRPSEIISSLVFFLVCKCLFSLLRLKPHKINISILTLRLSHNKPFAGYRHPGQIVWVPTWLQLAHLWFSALGN